MYLFRVAVNQKEYYNSIYKKSLEINFMDMISSKQM